MPNIVYQILFLILAYLFGSIPFGLLFGKIKGKDVRQYGSKNIGATNVGRVLGKKYFYIVFLLDGFKGFIFVFLFRFKILPYEWCLLSPIVYGIASSIGHIFPIFLKFKGGKAVSTSAGAVLGYSPNICLVGIFVFILTWLITKFVSLGSLLGASSVFISGLVISLIKHELLLNLTSIPTSNRWPLNLWFVIGVLILVALIFIRHKSNIERLKNNTETKYEFK